MPLIEGGLVFKEIHEIFKRIIEKATELSNKSTEALSKINDDSADIQ